MFCEFLAYIPDSDDRRFFLDYHRKEIRAAIEMGLVMKRAAESVMDYAEAAGRAHIEALTVLVATPPDPGWFAWADDSYLTLTCLLGNCPSGSAGAHFGGIWRRSFLDQCPLIA